MAVRQSAIAFDRPRYTMHVYTLNETPIAAEHSLNNTQYPRIAHSLSLSLPTSPLWSSRVYASDVARSRNKFIIYYFGGNVLLKQFMTCLDRGPSPMDLY